jgi:hypothetical protein
MAALSTMSSSGSRRVGRHRDEGHPPARATSHAAALCAREEEERENAACRDAAQIWTAHRHVSAKLQEWPTAAGACVNGERTMGLVIDMALGSAFVMGIVIAAANFLN